MAKAIDESYEPVSKRLRSKRPEEESETPEEEIETPEEEIETPEEETETPEEAEAEKRFVSPKKSLHTYQAGFVPKNTSVNTKWAVKNFIDWQTCYNSRHPKEPCPDDVLLSDNPAELSLWLQRYILGTRKKDGASYPPKVFNMECSSRSVVPSFSFGAATLSGCTINVYQGAYKPAGDSD